MERNPDIQDREHQATLEITHQMKDPPANRKVSSQRFAEGNPSQPHSSTQTASVGVSDSVAEASKQVGTNNPISAAAFTSAIFSLHPEYAAGKAGSLHPENTPTKKTPQEWLEEIRTLFDFEHAETFMASSAAPVIHGRLLVIGLSLLEPALRDQLESIGAFSDLVKELREPLREILTERGRGLYESSAPAKQKSDLSDSVPNWPDDPLLKPEEDLLGRRAFARFLARRIAAVRRDSGAYSMHVFGPWGAGKSTLLNFLSNELEPDREQSSPPGVISLFRMFLGKNQPKAKPKQWLVVEFNAWRQQQIQPPWWSLMEAVFKTTRSRLSHWELFQEYWWRFNTGRLQYIVAVIVLAWLVALGLFPLLRSQAADSNTLTAFGTGAESLSKMLALVATIWGGIVAANRSLLLGAARAAQNYADLT